ncbi:MAG: alpha/beta hydrolase [bacterium]|nr:alpha/beta hydrolase [bacterium]
MKNAIILHGGPSKDEYYDPTMPSMSNAHWIPWLQAQLLKKDIPTATPEIPNAYDRNWLVWSREVERFDITKETMLIGHSTGAGFFIKYLSIHPELQVGRVILVAPWLDPDRTKTVNFFDDFEIDSELVKRTNGITVWYSDNDEESVLKTAELIKKKTSGIQYKEFHNYGHFCIGDLKSNEFPELLELITEE